jgi:hypothetical protein
VFTTVALGLGVVAFLLVVLPAVMVPSDLRLTPFERLQAEGEWRGTLVQFLGSAAILAGLYFAGRSLQVSVTSARHDREMQLKTLALAERGQITDRFTKAVEQLASDKLDVRLGGVFALEHIAIDSDEYYDPIIAILTTFLKERARAGSSRNRDVPPPADWVAVGRVLGRRPARWWHTGLPMDLAEVDLAGANLWEAHFERAYLQNAHLEGTWLDGAYLQEADLSNARLHGAHFRGAHLERARFYGAVTTHTDFRSTNLSTVLGLTVGQIESAVTDDTTILPTDTSA